MLRGLYTAVSAMQTTEKKLDVTSNNMANINTTAFKKDVVITETFPEVLIEKINGQLPAEPFDKSSRVEVKQEGRGFRLSTQGGFFAVKSPLGISYNREIAFAVDESGYLKTYSRDRIGNIDTSQGNYILDHSGQPVLVEGEDIQINELGQVVVNGQTIANLIARSGLNVIGTMNSGLRLNKIETNFHQGSLEETGNPLHFALNGKGFFKVYTPDGKEMYTRNGNFTLNDNGEIITSEGYFLAGIYGSVMVDGMDFQLGEKGEIIVNNEVVDQIELFNIANVKDLRKYGEGYYILEEGMEVEIQPFMGELLQGFLESSNVDPVKEMVNMISIMRAYETNQKVVRTYDEILQRAVNEIAKL